MRKPSLLVIFLSVFIDLIGFGIVLPLLPRYVERFGGKGIVIGLVISSFSIMQFLFAPAWGRLSDRIGRRPVLLISNAGSAGSYALFATAASVSGTTGLLLLLASRIFAGICGANLSVASAYIADITPPEKRSKSMGLIGMAFGLGFILGPALGSLAGKYGLACPGWVASALCSTNFILGFFILGESRQPSSEHAPSRPRLKQWTHTLSHPQLGVLIGLYFLATLCFTCFESTLPLLLDKNVHYNESRIGLLFAYCGLVAAFTQGGLIGWLIKKFGDQRLISLSLFVVAISLIMLPFMFHLAGLLIALGLFAASSNINRAPTMGQISLNSAANEQGATMGVAQSAATLARCIGPPVATTLYFVRAPLPYFAAAAIAVIASLLAWEFLHKRQQTFSDIEVQKTS
jgi:DHA1 family tetracycline resistance protein-like MFS transporter